MSGYYEVRLEGAPGRRQYRLFCILDNGSPEELRERGFDAPQIAAVMGMVKDSGKKFSARGSVQPISPIPPPSLLWSQIQRRFHRHDDLCWDGTL
jgi:hypothetical protein